MDGTESSDMVLIVTSILTLIGTIFTGVMAYFMARLNITAESARREVEKVKTTFADTNAAVDTKLDGIAEVGVKTHALTNSAMEAQLKLNADLARWKATTTKDPGDAKAAEAAEIKHREHAEANAKLGPKTPSAPALPPVLNVNVVSLPAELTPAK